MRAGTVETLVWVLIYSGLLIAIVGWFVADRGSVLGWILIAGGLADAAVGILMIWKRSRMPDDDKETR